MSMVLMCVMPGLEKSTSSFTSGSVNSLLGGFAFYFKSTFNHRVAKIIPSTEGKVCRADPWNLQAALQILLQRVLPRSMVPPSLPGRKRTDKKLVSLVQHPKQQQDKAAELTPHKFSKEVFGQD